ncbi:hypothetical protein UA08_06166 [Talaromyces atroroseus]|uniref:F-box domain-containing protein n=1 Tax=Talaromyces atroroseus TaxID=1441469 RepID=A0A225AS64_TALAT|nr:hypothetical protein UA08_06166 [Talaromyces atroroseus]OKL58429.1 hypothetical protein UA08_06166 [Talaromyces atroroseus]
MRSLSTLPAELVLTIVSQLRNIEDFLALRSTCRFIYDVLSQTTTPRTILALLSASAPTFCSPHPHFLVAALARQVSAWTLAQPSARIPLLRDSFRGGIDSLYEFCLDHAPRGLSLDDIRRLHALRFSVINPLTDAIDRMAGPQWFEVDDFWDGGVSEPETLYTEPSRAVMQILVYGELFGSSFDYFLETTGSSHEKEIIPPVFSIDDRLEFVKYCIPDWNCNSWGSFQVDSVGPYRGHEAKAADQAALRHILTCRRWRRMWRDGMAKVHADDFSTTTSSSEDAEPAAHHWVDYFSWVGDRPESNMQNLSSENWRQKLYRDALVFQGLEGMQLVTQDQVSDRVLEKGRWIRQKIAEMRQPIEITTFGEARPMLVSSAPDLSQELWLGPLAGSPPADSQSAPSINDLSSILDTLTACLNSASTSLPSAIEPEDKASSNPTILPPADGISLLDTKAELLLSYLQNLVFLVLFQLRARGKNENNQDGVSRDDIVRKLAELRVYIDKGVKPLEGRLKYQIDKVIKAAEDAERATKSSGKAGKKNKQKNIEQLSDEEDEDSDQSDEQDSAEEEEDEEEDEDEDEQIDEMAYRPNITAFSKNMQQQKSEKEATSSKGHKDQSSDGIYRPPRIKPTALPTTDSRDRDRDRERRPKKSSVIDEFVSAEMSSAPMAQPSIGSTIQRGGRGVLTQKDREREAERRAYEETNFVRLPKESKKERAKRRAQEGPRTGGFGGEEFRLLREGADRIGRLTKRAAGSSSRDGALEKSRKRAFTEDGPRGDGTAVGQSFEKRRRKVEGWKK